MDGELMEAVKKVASIEQQVSSLAEMQAQARDMLVDILRSNGEMRERYIALHDAMTRAHSRIDKAEDEIENVRVHSQNTKEVTAKWLNRGFGFYVCVCLFFAALQWWASEQLKQSEEFKRDARNEMISMDRRLQKIELVLSTRGGRIPSSELDPPVHPNAAKYPEPPGEYQ